ncbi:MAG: phosphatidate cytidylyltransferase [Candidatus Latescibacterota bacterium]|nr:phosphatidate cytidylyltransferase [Candidatus Latescibacterota bacterium]
MATNLTQRVAVGAVFGPLILGVFWVGGLALLVVLCVLVGGGVWEFYRMQQEKGLQPWVIPGVVASLLWCLSVYFHGVADLVVPLAILLVLIAITGSGLGGRSLANVEVTLMGVLYVGVLASFAYQVRTSSFDGLTANETAGVATLILISIWISDIASYFAGRAFGKCHPFPEISPGKTEAGFVGGILGSVGIVVVAATQFDFLSLTDGVGLGLIVGVGAPAGDLIESMIKRDAGVKDASAVIPGHGGILDRFDSFLIVFPLVYVYISILQNT